MRCTGIVFALGLMACRAATNREPAPRTDAEAAVAKDAGPATRALVDIGEGWDHANLFKEPGYVGGVIGSVPRGASVEILSSSDEGRWSLVQDGEGHKGWVRSKVLSVEGRPSASHGDARLARGEKCAAKDGAAKLDPGRSWWMRVTDVATTAPVDNVCTGVDGAVGVSASLSHCVSLKDLREHKVTGRRLVTAEDIEEGRVLLQAFHASDNAEGYGVRVPPVDKYSATQLCAGFVLRMTSPAGDLRVSVMLDNVDGTEFVRRPPTHEEAAGVDACAYQGGFGFACLNALKAEKDPVRRRYMRRMTDATAHETFHGWMEPAHAEFAMECNDKGPCGKTTANGIPGDWGYACLTKAEAERETRELVKQGKDSPRSAHPAADAAAAAARSKAAHARACHCDPESAQIPVMGGSLACDGKDKPVERGGDVGAEEAAEILACAACDPDRGAGACAHEVQRLGSSDPELAKYIGSVHVARCRQP
jgi:uncharacterized protein YgiM (DUF1202 family)